MDLGDGPVGELHEPRRTEHFPRIGDVDEVMRDGGALLGRRLGGADVHAAIDLHGIHADDFAVELRRQAAGEGPLAGRGAAQNRDDAAFHTRFRIPVAAQLQAPGRGECHFGG